MDDDGDLMAANHLRAWREYRGMTQADLAAAVGTNANMIGYLENGKRGLNLKWLLRLAPALDITPGYLLDHDPNDLHPDIIDIWTKADERQRFQIAAIAETIMKTAV